jgi:hypothetical protein
MSRELIDARASSRRRAWMARMSAPETKAFSPAPVRIITVALAPRTSSRARCSSSTVALSRALRTSGRFTVIVATRPSTETSRFE